MQSLLIDSEKKNVKWRLLVFTNIYRTMTRIYVVLVQGKATSMRCEVDWYKRTQLNLGTIHIKGAPTYEQTTHRSPLV